jgi:L,D-transpeptidase ErfK/SrfK
MKPAKTQLTLIGMLILLAYSLGIAEPDEESSASTKIIIIRAANTLYLYSGDTILKTYKIAVGKKATPTPVGEFKIVNKIVNPGWFPQGKDSVPAGVSANPVGTRWMGLSEKGYGIHGTNKPSSIGKMASKGCIRMNNKDAEELFAMVKIGTPVDIIDKVEPVEVAQSNPEVILIADSYTIPTSTHWLTK